MVFTLGHTSLFCNSIGPPLPCTLLLCRRTAPPKLCCALDGPSCCTHECALCYSLGRPALQSYFASLLQISSQPSMRWSLPRGRLCLQPIRTFLSVVLATMCWLYIFVRSRAVYFHVHMHYVVFHSDRTCAMYHHYVLHTSAFNPAADFPIHCPLGHASGDDTGYVYHPHAGPGSCALALPTLSSPLARRRGTCRG